MGRLPSLLADMSFVFPMKSWMNTKRYFDQITPTIAENLVLLILNKSNVRSIDPHFRMELSTADPDENKFVDCPLLQMQTT